MKPQMSPHQLDVAIAGAIEEIEAHYSCGHAMNESAKEYANAVWHLNARVQLLAKALRFYTGDLADELGDSYVLDDRGATARAALTEAGLNEQKEG
jgi:hypothetical protein